MAIRANSSEYLTRGVLCTRWTGLANAEKVIEDLDRQIAELRAKCDEEKRRYEAAVKQREELLRSLRA